jgi:DNA (cytosine-5)-methyltransferase 1
LVPRGEEHNVPEQPRLPFELPDRDESQGCKLEPMSARASKAVVPSRIPSTGEHHEPWELTAAERAVYRERSRRSREAKRAALNGEGPEPIHPINVPRLDPAALMPQLRTNGIRGLSLFSGGGGMDLGFARAGYEHVASYEIIEDAALTLKKAHSEWEVFGGADGDVTNVAWRKKWRGKVDVIHGGPPCQPFSSAGRQRGELDPRDMFPEFVRAVLELSPAAFVAENVPALQSSKFADYVEQVILRPLGTRYRVQRFELRAESFGVPQVRRRVLIVGFKSAKSARAFAPPAPTHAWPESGTPTLGSDDVERCMGVREALGLPDIGFDALSPTIRSAFTGPRHTTSVLSSTAARRTFERLQIWPNGVATTREHARAFVAENHHFRLSLPDVGLIQGFPESWPFVGANYMVLGQIGNAVAPPMAYAVARSVSAALSAS